jgi:DNA replication protein DnaC
MTHPRDADHVRQALHTLNLECMAASLDAFCEQAAKEAWSYATLLAHLLREELTAGEERRLAVATQMARFPFHKTLEQFDFAFQPSVEKRRIQELASLRFVADGSNVLLLGPPAGG